MINEIKYGIIGCGHLGNYHALQLKKIGSVCLLGCYDIKQTRSLDFSKKHTIKHYSSLESLLKLCDAISITTPASNHYTTTLLALKAGCNVFIEKPFTQKVVEAQKLIKLKNLYNLKMQIGHIEQFNPAFLCFLKKNPFPVFIESHRLSSFNERGLDVDVILDLMVHDIDLVLALVNSKIINIYASGSKILTNSMDIANVRLEFKNGATANLTASRISLKQMRQMRIFELNSYSVLDFQTQEYNSWFIDKKSLKHKHINVIPSNALYEELKFFIKSILDDSPVYISGETALKTLKIANKIQKIIANKK